MKEKLLSIIVPTYNMELFLNRCLDSLLVASVLEYIEVLVINDGSKDGSSEIAHSYKMQYPESIIVIDKENGGYGSVLNVGLLYASGKYFKICDADDWFDSNVFCEFILQLKEIDADIVYNGYSKEYFNGKSVNIDPPFGGEVSGTYPYSFENANLVRLLYLPEITYKTNVLKECNLIFLEKTLYVDLEYITFPILKVKSIAFTNCNLYRYFIGRVGQSVSRESMERNIHNIDKVIESITCFYISNKLSADKKMIVRRLIAETNTTMLCTYLLSYRKERKWAMNTLKNRLYSLKNGDAGIYNCIFQNRALPNYLLRIYVSFPYSAYFLPRIYQFYTFLKS